MGSIPIYKLRTEDLLNNPVWGWDDDDSMFIEPVATIESIQEDYDALFVRAEHTLANNSHRLGYVLVRTSDFNVYGIGLWDDRTGAHVHLPLQPEILSETIQQGFLDELDLPVGAVLPLQYVSSGLADLAIQLNGKVDGFRGDS